MPKNEKMPALAFTPISTQRYHLRRQKIYWRYWPTLILSLIDGAMCEPLIMLEKLFHRKSIQNHVITAPPVFIVGHWRSGTTYLHNLLTQNPDFGYPSLFHTLFPECFNFAEFTKTLLKKCMPDTRKIDNMVLNPDFPQEEEFAIARLTPHSFYHALRFPLKAGAFFKKYVLLQGMSGGELMELRRAYLLFAKKVSMAHNGKQLIFKSPINTARIDFIKSIFPEVKFIHIFRNPFDIYQSFLNTMKILTEDLRIQPIPEDRVMGDIIIHNYNALMKSYFEQKKRLPESCLAEVGYENLVAEPEKEIRRICEHIDLPFGETAMDNLHQYLGSQKNYKKNRFPLPDALRIRLRKHWAFTLNMWGYEL